MVLSHKHPEDYRHVSATVHAMRASHRPFSTRHRIITVQGETRDVVVIGEELRDETGALIGTHGYYIDVTRIRDAQMDAAVADIADSRAAIEKVKGVLSVVYHVPPEAAFDILKWRSQETNVKLRVLAEQLMADFADLGGVERLPPRSVFDHLLLTAHQRVRK